MVKAGQKAPEFEAETAGGWIIRLSDFQRRRPVVLFFYSEDFHPSCTREACLFRDHLDAFDAFGAVVLGVGRDTRHRHKAFTKEFYLNYQLIADPEGQITKAFGAHLWLGMLPFGRKSFVIDTHGVVRGVISNPFSPKAHVDGSLRLLSRLGR